MHMDMLYIDIYIVLFLAVLLICSRLVVNDPKLETWYKYKITTISLLHKFVEFYIVLQN